MTAAARGSVRAAVDAARREQIDWSHEPRCCGCGVELRDPITEAPRYVDGCRPCINRKVVHRSRRTRKLVQLAFDVDTSGRLQVAA